MTKNLTQVPVKEDFVFERYLALVLSGSVPEECLECGCNLTDEQVADAIQFTRNLLSRLESLSKDSDMPHHE